MLQWWWCLESGYVGVTNKGGESSLCCLSFRVLGIHFPITYSIHVDCSERNVTSTMLMAKEGGGGPHYVHWQWLQRREG
jgi:hypothetical protein